MDDPGWGDHVPVSPDNKPATSRGPGSRGRGPLSSLGGPWVLGAVILVVIIGIGVALKLSSGTTKKTVSTVKTTVPSTTTTAKKPKPKPKPAVKTLAIKSYDKKADAICTTDNAKMNRANSARNLPEFATYFQKEWLAVAKLPHPSVPADAAQMKKAIKDAETALSYLKKNNYKPNGTEVTDANNFLISAHTIEGVLGMKVCNFGH